MIVEIRLEDPEGISHPVSGLGDSFLKASTALSTNAIRQQAVLPQGWQQEAFAVYEKLSPACPELDAEFVDYGMTMETCRIVVRIRYRYLDLPEAEDAYYPVSSNRYAAMDPQEIYDE